MSDFNADKSSKWSHDHSVSPPSAKLLKNGTEDLKPIEQVLFLLIFDQIVSQYEDQNHDNEEQNPD
jgi:hypothetical protein